jgi:long-chain acyl-CoA synthetase
MPLQARPWHRSYPPGMPLDAPIEAGLTLPALLERSFERYAARTAYTCFGASLSYRSLDRFSHAFAAYLQAIGLKAGDRVALMLPNSLAYPVALAGALRAGMAVVSINPLYTARELEHQLRDSGARAIVTHEPVLPLLARLGADSPIEQVVCASAADMSARDGAWQPSAGSALEGVTWLAGAIANGESSAFTPPALDARDIAFLQYTGGTTGAAKGAALTHASMLAAVQIQLTWMRVAFEDEGTACVTPLPLYHIYPINVLLMLLSRGGTNRLVQNPREIEQLIGELKRAPFGMLLGVNTLLNGLLASGRLDKADFAGTHIVICAGAATQRAVAERWKAATGVPISESYGLTECSPGVTSNVIGGADWTGTIGVPVPSTDVRMIDAEGRPVALGERGELCVKGPQVFAGYWQRPEETRSAFTADGWLRTGDVATMDEMGLVRIVDRLKDMILVSGFNVYPNEIEGVVAMMPEVLECACIGVPDERSGEAPHLFVVTRDAGLTAAQIEAHCRDNLTAYKRPRHISFVEALPKSAVGKILRKELRSSSMVGDGLSNP